MARIKLSFLYVNVIVAIEISSISLSLFNESNSHGLQFSTGKYQKLLRSSLHREWSLELPFAELMGLL